MAVEKAVMMLAALLIANHAAAESRVPPELDVAIRAGIEQHPDIAAAQSDVSSAKAKVEAGSFRWLPKIEATSQLSKSGSGVGSGAGRVLNVGLKQPIWDAGRINADFELAQAEESVSLSAQMEAQETIAMRIVAAYFGVMRTREQVEVMKRSVADHVALYTMVNHRSAAGLGTKSDVAMAISRLQQARAAQDLWEGEVNRAESAYYSLVNQQPPAKLSGLKLSDMGAISGLRAVIEAAKSRSPQLERLRNQLVAAQSGAKSSKAQLFPTLYARADRTSYLGNADSLYQDNTRLSVNFEWQSDVAISQRYQVEAADKKVEAARYAVDSAERQLTEVVTGYWEDFVTAQKRSEALQKFADSAAETVDMFKRQFRIGRRSWPEVMNSLQDFYGAQNQQVEAKYQVMVARMRLAITGGELDGYVLAKSRTQDTNGESLEIHEDLQSH